MNSKICECCGKRPVGAGKNKYCKKCAPHHSIISKYRKLGKDISSLWFTGNRLCECCGKNPIAEHHSKYCDVCKDHYPQIYKARKQSLDLSTLDFTKGRLCKCCRKRPIASGKQKYCKECSKHLVTICQAKKRGADISQLGFTGNKRCECCGTRTVEAGHQKYCNVCSAHFSSIKNTRYHGKDISNLTFTGNRICQHCGINSVPIGNLKYCKQCSLKYKLNYYEFLKERDLKILDTGAELLPCPRCKQNPRAFGQFYCKSCQRELAHKTLAKAKGLDHYTPYVKPIKSTLCFKCGTAKRYTNHAYCEDCYRKYQEKWHITRSAPWCIKKTNIPKVYYTWANSKLDCPICKAEYCIAGLPMGQKCRQKILRLPRYKLWQNILECQGIRVPTVNEIIPEGKPRRGYCKKCQSKPVSNDRIFCEECWKSIQENRKLIV